MVVETIGWIGRTWSARCPYNHVAFLLQISSLVIAPNFVAAGIYVMFSHLISSCGTRYSLISNRAYFYIFCSSDVISLLVQAAGGGLASQESRVIGGDTRPGTRIILVGIIFQLATLSCFILLFAAYWSRTQMSKLEKRLQIIIAAMTLSVVMIFIRCIYRSVELAQGWTGYLITHQGYFIVLDGAVMVIAVGIFNLAGLFSGTQEEGRLQNLNARTLTDVAPVAENRTAY